MDKPSELRVLTRKDWRLSLTELEKVGKLILSLSEHIHESGLLRKVYQVQCNISCANFLLTVTLYLTIYLVKEYVLSLHRYYLQYNVQRHFSHSA